MQDRFAFLALALVVGGFVAIGCSDSSSLPASPSSISGVQAPLGESLTSGTWTLVALQVAGQSQQAAPAGATYAVTFADGRLSTRADCNTCGGAYGLAGETLTVGPALACTRAACRTMEFENTYTRVLDGPSTVTLSGNTLVLSSPRGVLQFTR
jgi:heat shock protein HslJ